MVSAADIAHELDEGLRELFQAGLALSLQVQDDAMAAQSADERAKLGLTFHRLSRGVRQTAALRTKLARDAERAQRETAEDLVQLDRRRLDKRKAHVKAAVEGLIWTEAESPEALDHLKAELEDLLDIETQDAETFEDEPLDVQIERLCRVIGLPIPPLSGVGAGGEPGGLVAGGTDREAVEGASAARSQPPGLSGSPLSPSGTAPPSGGAIGAADDDPLLSDDYWRSSA